MDKTRFLSLMIDLKLMKHPANLKLSPAHKCVAWHVLLMDTVWKYIVYPDTDQIKQYEAVQSVKTINVPEGLLAGSAVVNPYKGIPKAESQETYDVQQSLALEDISTGGYIVIARQTRQIIWLDSNGDVTRRVDMAACDMVLDGQQLLFVVDGQTDHITVLSLQTDFHMTLPVDPPLHAPSRICLDSQNKQLYVVHQTEAWDAQEIVSLPYPRDWILSAVQSQLEAASLDEVYVSSDGNTSRQLHLTTMSRKLVNCNVSVTLPQLDILE